MNIIASYDENNNEESRRKGGFYVERHLELGNGSEIFLIIPNGGSGDCMFKAVSQAVYSGDESRHKEIRKRVVNFIISQRWEKFSESIEVQHINGNNLLQRQWAKDPKDAYRTYMTMAGTLGSSSELTAAGELFHYNFATIQEYCNSSSESTYRVENCILFDESSTHFHYFYFTGDYDNGHWEYMQSASNRKLEDGTYQGRHRIVINGEDIGFDDWLRRETENNNDPDLLKIATNHELYMRRRTAHPFELKSLHFCRDSTVRLKGNSFRIAPVQRCDLFSVLAHECLKNEEAAHEIELILMKHRYQYFDELNYKLITQPWSHNFNVEAIRYCGHAVKGNIQDLIAAADLYSFSFVLFLKLGEYDETQYCKFTHVDRWGGESERVLYFFMRLSRCRDVEREQLIAKWWRLIPVHSDSVGCSDVKIYARKSISKLEFIESSTNRNGNSMQSSTTFISGRPATADLHGSQSTFKSMVRAASAGPLSARYENTTWSTADAILKGVNAQMEIEPKCQILEGGITVTRISDSDGELQDSIRRDHENIFGPPRPVSRSSSKLDTKSDWSRDQPTNRASKTSVRKEKIKPATGMDLVKHPEKVKTIVKISDKGNAGRSVMYKGSGYMRPDDVLTDLRSQGLIRSSSRFHGRASSFSGPDKHSELALQKLLSVGPELRQVHYNDSLSALRDENFNLISETKEDTAMSDVSFEKFNVMPAQEAVTQAKQNDYDRYQEENISRQVSHGQQFPPQDLIQAARGYTRSKSNRVAPEQRCAEHFENDGNGSPDEHSCVDRFFQLLSRIRRSLRNLKKRVKRGLIRKYQGRPSSSLASLVNAQKRQKNFPRREYKWVEGTEYRKAE